MNYAQRRLHRQIRGGTTGCIQISDPVMSPQIESRRERRIQAESKSQPRLDKGASWFAIPRAILATSANSLLATTLRQGWHRETTCPLPCTEKGSPIHRLNMKYGIQMVSLYVL